MTMGTFASLHAKCMNSAGCTGPGCKVVRARYSTAEPRVRDSLPKGLRKLANRREDYDTVVTKGPMPTQFHRPGSQK